MCVLAPYIVSSRGTHNHRLRGEPPEVQTTCLHSGTALALGMLHNHDAQQQVHQDLAERVIACDLD